jgi:hypothetical protein
MTPAFRSLRDQFYAETQATPDFRPASLVLSDVVLHLPVLEWFASHCGHVTEFGTRDGRSTVALVAGCRGEVHSYDIVRTAFARQFADVAKPCRWFFHQASTVDETIPVSSPELLFVDTLHTYDHVARELALHGRKASRYLAFHDTYTCGERDRSGPDPRAPGIVPAIEEFVARHAGDYDTAYRTNAGNGLWVLRRL